MSDKNKKRADKPQVSPEARRKQVIVGIVMGAIVGVVISLLTQFWLWLPAGVALGLATGVIMKPPQN
ncbi:MAG: HPP family protein [Leucobacter sp.]|jgi:uncharacterized membrane protein YoaK (UPF0700 family)|nr:HPP family protein [Leucobacter sp.]